MKLLVWWGFCGREGGGGRVWGVYGSTHRRTQRGTQIGTQIGTQKGTRRGTPTGVSEKIWCQVKKRILFSRAETEEPTPKTIKHTREATDGKLWRAELRVIRN